MQRHSNLGSLTRFTFDNLIPEGKHLGEKSQEMFLRAYETAVAYADAPAGWLVLAGPSGCGKTHLAAAIANRRIDRGCPVFYISTPDLLDHLRSAFSPSSDMGYDEFFYQVRNAELLILDDLGAQTDTPWAKEKLEQLLNYRYNAELPTVIVTIVPLEDIDERIYTRLSDDKLSRVYNLEEKQTSPLEHTSGLDLELLRNMTFDKFDWKRVNLPPEQRQNLEQVYRTAMEYVKAPDGWLVLQGVNGCGKTHLAVAIANEYLHAGRPVLFVVVPDLLDHLRSTFAPDSKISYDQLFESVKTIPLLILDDFGEQATTPWAQEKLYQIINYRYNSRLATVITTCCSLDEIESRISSRLVDPKISMIYNILVPDFRGDRPPVHTLKKVYRRGKRERFD